MKIKYLFLTVLLLTAAGTSLAQAKKTPAKTAAAIPPAQVVANLYAAQKIEKTNPFAQSRSRTLIDKYFTGELADLIWKNNTASGDGWKNIDPLYNAQSRHDGNPNTKITDLVVGKAKEDASPDGVYLKVTFKNYGKAEAVDFSLGAQDDGTWKISSIGFSDGEDLISILRYTTDADYQKAYDADQTFRGGYMIGTAACDVMPTMNRMFYRVTCDGQPGFKLYMTDGGEKETSYTNTDDNGKELGKFVFKKGENDGKYFDAAGKEVKVKRAGTPGSPAPVNPESDNVSGELILGKTESVILYTGMETGDYAAYCFTNDSAEGRAILAACKNKDQCEITATLGEGDGGKRCKVPGLKASLSAEFWLTKVASAKSLGRRK